MRELKESLIEEMEFWRKMLDETKAKPESNEYQRLVMALKLVAFRLDSVCNTEYSALGKGIKN